MTIQELSANRRELVEIQHKNGFTEGINKLLSDLYPDTAHFVYELLQNAEDMNATIVRFILSDDGLDFEHNGTKRDFTIDDIDAITNIGHNIQKRNDPTSIGKFGVGFKSVFSYTATPEIHSGEFNFRIHDYFVPVFENVPKIPTVDSSGVSWTKFYFPFNNPKKPPISAKQEIVETFEGFDSYSILFLSNIKKIEYMMPDSSLGYVELSEDDSHFITISHKKYNSDHEETSNFLRFQKPIDIIIDNQISKKVNIGVAYNIQINKDNTRRIVSPKDDGKTFIYFPTTKEHSNLRFHINAPFASTVARESIRNCEDNIILIKKIGRLIVETIEEIKDMDIVYSSLLNVLPHEEDTLSWFYTYIYDYIINAFLTKPLIPVKDGGFANASDVFITSKKISDLFSAEDIYNISGEKYNWVSMPASNSEGYKFINSSDLEIKTFGFNDLKRLIDDRTHEFEKFISNISDEWLVQFYIFFKDNLGYNSSEVKEKLSNCHFVRGNDNKMYKPSEIYLYPDPSEPNLIYVKHNILEYTAPQFDGKYPVKLLMEKIGVCEFDNKERIESILENYRYNEITLNDEYYNNMLVLARYYKRNDSNYDFRFVSVFASSYKGKLYKARASDLFLDQTYDNRINEIISEDNGFPVLFNGYKERYSETELSLFLEFAKYCGINDSLKIIKCDARKNPNFRKYLESDAKIETWCGKNVDYTIANIEAVLKNPSLKKSKFIWNLLADTQTDYFTDYAIAMYSPNNSAKIKQCDSTLIYYLKNIPWIPDKSGREFFKPADISFKSINKSFSRKTSSLIMALDIGKNINERKEEIELLKKRADELGYVLISKEESRLFDELKNNVNKNTIKKNTKNKK
ncbi:MAG: sacsin N-terminal ATP-binding-like domain-containing protein [Oscillospiraceae bacterium]